uniref:RNA-directed DNA polymerase n=1 Tax=Plectus sambesii TaxID=2011161 RepID=A0A914VZT6_9BILA
MATGTSVPKLERHAASSPSLLTSYQVAPPDKYNIGDSWKTWSLVFKVYLEERGTLSDKDKKVALLSCLSIKAVEELQAICEPSEPLNDAIKFEDLMDSLNKRYLERTNDTLERNKFFQLRMGASSLKEFVTVLKKAAASCKFPTAYYNMALTDGFILGVPDHIRSTLIRSKPSNLPEALELAETVQLSKSSLDARPQSSGDLNINQIQRKGHQRTTQKKGQKGQPSSAPAGNGDQRCQSCGRTDHLRRNCRHLETTCNHCSKKGHIEAVCRAKQKPSSPPLQRSGQKNQRVTCVRVNNVESVAPPFSILTKMEGVPVEMEFDCGAGCSIIPRSIWKKIKKPPLRPTSTRCFTYTGAEIPIDGEASITVVIDERAARVPVLVTANTAPIMGRSWFASFDIDLRKSLIHLKKMDNAVNAVATKPSAPTALPAASLTAPRLEKGKGTTEASLAALLNDYLEVFAEGLGYCTKLKALLQLKDDAKPVFIKAQPLPFALKPTVEMEFNQLAELQVVSAVDYSEWAAPIVVALKPGGKICVCADFSTGLNKQLDLHQHPLPRTQDLLASLGKNKYYTKIDFSDAYLQIELDDKAKKLVVVSTHKGLYRYNRLPFGVSSAPSIFQKMMDTMLQGIDGVHVYIDDIVIVGRTKEEHRAHLRSVLSRIKDFGFHVRKDKCSFEKSEIVYLGFIINNDGICADLKKIAAITDMPQPGDVKALKAFLGMVNHYHCFIPNLADLEQPLTHLSSSKTPWKWSTECKKAFCDVKKILSGPMVVGHYNPDEEIIVAADASAYGIGARIYHRYANGQEKVVAYASKKLDAAQKNYGQIKKEALALVFAITKFHQYLFGREFTLLTDHKPLVTIFGDKKGVPVTAASRLQRWAIKLLGYTFTIEYRKTEDFGQVDGLSRLPASDDKDFDSSANRKDVKLYQVVAENQEAFCPISTMDVLRETKKDATLQRVKKAIDHGWSEKPDAALQPYFKYRHDLNVIKGCICWGARTVIPPSLCARVLQTLHKTHPGIVAMKSIAHQHCWWPGKSEDIVKLVHDYSSCAMAQKTPQKTTLSCWLLAQRAIERVHIDYAEYKGKQLLLLVDAYSKWPEVILMNSTTANATAAALYSKVFSAFGYPQLIVSDNGRQFASEEFASFCHAHGIQHLFSPAYHLLSNGQVEREVDSVKQALLKQELEGGSMEEKLLAFLMRYRATPLESTGHSPAELFIGRSIRTDLHQLYPALLSPTQKQQKMT